MAEDAGRETTVLDGRQRLVPVEGEGPILVEKWPLTKGLLLVKEIIATAGGAAAEITEALARKDVGAILDRWAEKAIVIAELSVREEDRERIRLLTAEDFLAVLVEALDMNLTGRLLGKAKALGVLLDGRLGLVLPAVKSPTP